MNKEIGNRQNVHVTLKRSLDVETQVVGLHVAQLAQLGVDVVEMQQRDLLVQDLRKHVDADILLASLAELDVLLAEFLVLGLEQHDLSEDLVGEGARHDEGRVAGCAPQVDETTFGEEDDVATVRHEVTVDLGLDASDGLGVLLKPRNVDFNVKVANV